MAASHHAIKAVSRRTGLSAHVIRIWEKRYGAVEPERTGTNRRLYSEDQIQRLGLLRDLTHAGHSIGHVAKLPPAKLRELAAAVAGTKDPATRSLPVLAAKKSFLGECVAAVTRLAATTLENTLQHAPIDRKSPRTNSSHRCISYAVISLKIPSQSRSQ